jgi:hypothetical protein
MFKIKVKSIAYELLLVLGDLGELFPWLFETPFGYTNRIRNYNSETGCRIPVVRLLWEQIDWVQFPAPRPRKKNGMNPFFYSGAGCGNRTRAYTLEGYRTTIIQIPHEVKGSYFVTCIRVPKFRPLNNSLLCCQHNLLDKKAIM